jgi:transposase
MVVGDHETLFSGFTGADSLCRPGPGGITGGDCPAFCGEPLVRGAPLAAVATDGELRGTSSRGWAATQAAGGGAPHSPDGSPGSRCYPDRPVRAGSAAQRHPGESQDYVRGDPPVTLAAEKKSLYASEQETPRVKRLRHAFRRRRRHWADRRLKFLDETGVTIRLTPLYGRAAPGVRVVEAVPRNYGQSLSVLAVLGSQGLSAPMTVLGPVDASVFRVYIEQVLGPTLPPGDIVVMDNLAVHKGAGIAQAITAHGARVEYLPPYSPDWNPIEQGWSKLKTLLRQRKARTRRAVERALTALLPTISSADARAWFYHCGYSLH